MQVKTIATKTPQLSTRYCTTVSSLDNSFLFKNQQIKQKIPGDEIIQISPFKNFLLQEKLQVLLRAEDNIIDKIKKKMQLKKQNSKMSILSMQKQKFIVSRGPSTFRRVLNSLPKQQYQSIKQNSLVSMLKNNASLQYESIRRQGNSYKNQKVQKFKTYLKILALNHQKKNKGRKSQILARSLIDYFNGATVDKILKDLFQLQMISDELIRCLTKKDYLINLNIFRKIENDTPKLIFNICYEVYRRKKKGVTHEELLKINKQIQYYSRRLGMLDLTLRTCFDLGKLNCDKMNYDEAFIQYQKAVKLAIHIGNKYYQEVAVDKMGMCKYYMADTSGALFFHNNSSHLSNYDRIKIKEQYSNQYQIACLLQQKKKLKVNIVNQDKIQQKRQFQINIGEFKFQNQTRKQNYSVLNNIQLKNNYKNIIKLNDLKSKIHLIKKCVNKIQKIGSRRYCGQHYLVPKASRFTKNEGGIDINQVCLSHRSFNRSNVQHETIKIQNQCKALVRTLNYFINDGIIQISQKQIDKQS